MDSRHPEGAALIDIQGRLCDSAGARVRHSRTHQLLVLACCALAWWPLACSEGYTASGQRQAVAQSPSPEQGGANAGQPAAGCANCAAGSTVPLAGISGVAGQNPPPAGSPAAAGSGVAGSGVVAGASAAGSGAAGSSAPAGAGGGAGAAASSGQTGAAGSGGRAGAAAGGGTSGGAGTGGRAGAAGASGRGGACDPDTCPDTCSGLERPCCKSNGMCGCRLLLACD
jgi:hypothetical protein